MEQRQQGVPSAPQIYQEWEKLWIYLTLMFAGGFLGAFTYTLRGGVFCNAQTGNFVLLAMAMGRSDWGRALYLLVPISAYCAGAAISETLAGPERRIGYLRWETALVMVEIAVVALLGLVPETAPYQITQVAVNFICSMQYSTFLKAQGIPMATTFCTNHIRQVGVFLVRSRRNGGGADGQRLKVHLAMIAVFVAGGVVSVVLCDQFLGKAVWGALVPLSVVLADFLRVEWKKRKSGRQTAA